MNEGNKTWIYILNILLLASVVFVLAVVSTYTADLEGNGFVARETTVTQVNDGWVRLQEGGEFSDFRDFNKELDTKSITLSRIFVFDRDDFSRDTLSFFSNNCIVEIYQDGALIYSKGTPEDIERRHLPGHFNVSAVMDVYPGEASEITVKLASYLDVKVSPFYFGSGYDVSQDDLSSSMPGIVFVVLSIVIIILIIFFALIGRRKYSIPVSYNYFLLFVIIATIWVASNINVLSYTGFNAGLLGLIANESFMMFPLFFGLFIYHYFKRWKALDMTLVGLSFLNLILMNILSLSKVVSIVEAFMPGAVLSVACLVLSLFQSVDDLMRNGKVIRTYAMFIGSLFLLFGGVSQLVAIAREENANISIFMLISLVIFNLVHSMAFIFDLMTLVAEGRKAGDYLVMAKTDTLTGLGNRRGLESYISEISSGTSAPFYRVGCIVCDLNGLKKTNDTYGHDVGDQMLKDFADCLKECFENRGVPFRSGGDEFYIMFSDVEVDMGAMMRRLMIGIDGTNTRSEYKLSCSSGCYADYVPSHNENAVWDIIKMADAEMYKQKLKDRSKIAKAEADSRLD